MRAQRPFVPAFWALLLLLLFSLLFVLFVQLLLLLVLLLLIVFLLVRSFCCCLCRDSILLCDIDRTVLGGVGEDFAQLTSFRRGSSIETIHSNSQLDGQCFELVESAELWGEHGTMSNVLMLTGHFLGWLTQAHTLRRWEPLDAAPRPWDCIATECNLGAGNANLH